MRKVGDEAVPLLMTTDEVSELLGLDPSTLKQLRDSGNGPTFYRISPRLIRYKSSAARRWHETHSRG